jgi:amidohydrolase
VSAAVDATALKQRASEGVRAVHAQLVELSHAIHERPELAFEEHFAHEVLTDALADAGLPVERGAYDLDTAFAATVGGGAGPHVVLCCEYDALPEIGHACGHNMMGTAALGAGLALAEVVADAGGRLTILGTPAEERAGGKITLAERGAFEGVDVAMMVHAAGADVLAPAMLAMIQLDVRMTGRAAHASAFPWRGINALDAIVGGYVNVSMLRQQLHPTDRVHGVIRRGGDVPNVIPQVASARYNIRTTTAARLDPLQRRVLACFEAAATATGCSMEHRFVGPYEDLLTNDPLAEAYRGNAEAIGRDFVDLAASGSPSMGSTDMGNVSHIVPSIHPTIGIAPPGTALHTAEFAEHAISEAADQGIADAATALAHTAIDVWTDGGLVAATRAAFTPLSGT